METRAPINDIGEAGSSRKHKPVQITEAVEGWDYEVFLSFRGPDTRIGIADYLYISLKEAGIRTYRDNEELHFGEEIGPELLGAIEQSKVSIPIFSNGYASSRWCLNELAHMVDCRRKGQIIMPIFYYVEPSEVQNQTGGYSEALLAHENKKSVDDETMRKWRAALNEVGGLKGWDIQNGDRHEGQLVKHIITKVLSALKKAYLVITDFLVGVDNNVKDILGMISTNIDDVKIVGIHGMGGIGKMTLAKVVYNKLSQDFDDCCFLDDVRETSNLKGIVYLQNHLISDLSKRALPFANCVDEGIMMIEERFSSKKALIFLDDVDEKSQLIALLGRRCCFGPGSQILITTRNAIVLREFDVKLIYPVGEMDSNRLLQLFSKHAFRRDHPPPEKLELSREIVKIAQGLPLVLEVMGSTLSWCEQREDIWDEYLEKWKMGHIEAIQSKLIISYEALDPCQRQIFLDIACLFIGYDKNIVMYMWKDCGLCPAHGLEVLQMMSLIKIGKGNELWMHDHLKDLGREIASQETLSLKFDEFLEYCFPLERFATLPNLRFLQADSTSLNSNSVERFLSEAALLWHNKSLIFSTMNILKRNRQLLPNLRWLTWHNFPLQAHLMTYFSMNNLVILDFSWSNITYNWGGWRHIKRACKLKVLNLANCTHLTKTPDLSELLTLERLILDDCYRLAEIDSSINKLKNLIFLSLIACRELQYLPKELGGLPSLAELLLDGTSIREIPEWWALDKLENPNVHNSPSVKTSGSINCLTSLSKLSLVSTFITHLPDSIGALTSLERLNLKRCRINKLPYSIGKLRSLTESDLFCTGITKLPDSMECLENLKALIVFEGYDSESISALPKLPKSLTSLALSSMSLEAIPDLSNLINLELLLLFMGEPDISSLSEFAEDPMPWWLGRLSKLQSLVLCIPHMTSLSPELGDLSHLKFLYLFQCASLQCIPQISSSILKLYIMSCWSLTTLDISNLKTLSQLRILDTPVEDLSGRELLDNLLEWKIEKNENNEKSYISVIEELVKMVLDWHSIRNI
ncbi:hypothetical protein ACJRO7_014653 [Eucalyptus globulus]|uniref:TIR domain-containing protein n=1 Tax=Eucalyptus globulus TaxID=34317 RepID=A0ABD3L0W7_EUCGL